MDAEARVKLTEIGGDIKLIRQSQEQSERNVDRIERLHADFVRRTDERLHVHGNRIGALEAAKYLATGREEGTARTLKTAHVIWASATSASAVGIIAALLRSWHV